MASSYRETYSFAQENPEQFWLDAAGQMDWVKPPSRAFDAEVGIYGRWFVDGICNTCFNAVDRHVLAGRGDQAALIYDSPITGNKRTYSYSQLQDEVVALAAVLREQDVGVGDRVIIYMPMIPQAMFAMLACARLGAVHSVVFGGFAAKELATRIDDCTPKVIISASCGIEPSRVVDYKPLLNNAIEMASWKVGSCIIFQREQQQCTLINGRDLDYATEIDRVKAAGIELPCMPVRATDPLYILYTSGTTGQPKGVIRDNGGHMVALHWTMENEYGVKPGEVFWAASDVGWVVGHSYIVYAPLLAGCTTVLYEGKPIGTPDAGAFWRVIAEHNVTALFVAPTALRAIKGQDPKGDLVKDYDLSGFRTLFLAGERADPETIKWAETVVQVPVIDHWWQTETGHPITQNPVGLGQMPVKYGSPGLPMPGFDVHILDDNGTEVPRGTLGNVAIKLPLPPSCLPTLWNADERFIRAYLTEFPGYYQTADAGIIDDDGYVFIMARTDDIINVAGHRLSTGAMEEVVAEHPDVAESAVIGIADEIKGQAPFGFIVLNAGVTRDKAEIQKEVITLVRNRIGPVASFKSVVTVKGLPKTRSGKILRGTMQKIADAETWSMPAAIEDPAVLEEIQAVIREAKATLG